MYKTKLTKHITEDSYTTSRTVDGKTYRLDIIDTAGQEEYRDMLGSLFSAESSIDAYLLVYDITSQTSLENLEYFDELIEKTLESGIRPESSPHPVKIVAGNKCDLSESRTISSEEGLKWANAHGCGFMETSAKLRVNIEETFEVLIRQVQRNRNQAAGIGANAAAKSSTTGIAQNLKNKSKVSLLSSHSTKDRHNNKEVFGQQQAGGPTSHNTTAAQPLQNKPHIEKMSEEPGQKKEKKRGCCVIS